MLDFDSLQASFAFFDVSWKKNIITLTPHDKQIQPIELTYMDGIVTIKNDKHVPNEIHNWSVKHQSIQHCIESFKILMQYYLYLTSEQYIEKRKQMMSVWGVWPGFHWICSAIQYQCQQWSLKKKDRIIGDVTACRKKLLFDSIDSLPKSGYHNLQISLIETELNTTIEKKRELKTNVEIEILEQKLHSLKNRIVKHRYEAHIIKTLVILNDAFYYLTK